jgi:hypothetical protein
MYKKTEVVTKERVKTFLDEWIEAPRETVDPVPLTIEVSNKTHGFYQLLPQFNGVLDEPVEIDGWRYVPRNKDDSPVPKEAERQIKALKDAGVVILQEVIGHNLIEEAETEAKKQRYKDNIKTAQKLAVGAFFLVGLLVLGVARVALAVASFALTADPAYIVVLEDGQWLCIVDWDS